MSRHDWPVKLDVFGCWIWNGKRGPDGYGVAHGGEHAHIQVWTSEVGPVPDGLQLDHACRRRACVNPLHLEPVTKAENEKRKSMRRRRLVLRCKRGHDRIHATLTPEGGIVCRQCNREQQKGTTT